MDTMVKKLDVWFVTGSQHLYGPATLQKVEQNARAIATALDHSPEIPVKIICKPVVKTPEEISSLMNEANNDKNCIGLITWCHTFSPSKMWIAGLKILHKPLLHLHTQFNCDLPWDTIDMDFMNLNQAAHGDREHGFIMSRMRMERKVVVGYWQEKEVQEKTGIWARAAMAWYDMQGAKVVRFGDNMREVAVTEGDKVEAQICFGYSVNTHGVGDLVQSIRQVSDAEAENLCDEYESQYVIPAELRKGGAKHEALKEAARIEAGLRHFLRDGNFKAFTTTFEDLHGLTQLPGLAVQRLMAEGYGFGAEGDWKTAMLVRTMKCMAEGLKGGTSFMEDYTYHLNPSGRIVLGAHMLEVCPSVAAEKPRVEVKPLSIGGKADPARLIFTARPGPAINASVIDLGNRFRLIVNKVEVTAPEKPMPNLPVASVVWKPLPDLYTAAAAWIYAGGAHHTAFSQALTTEYMEDFAAIAGVEMVTIDENTCLPFFKKELKWNEVYYLLNKSLSCH